MTRAQYVTEWSTKAHRAPSDVYVPASLQPDLCLSCGWAREVIVPAIDGPGNHTGCSEGKW